MIYNSDPSHWALTYLSLFELTNQCFNHHFVISMSTNGRLIMDYFTLSITLIEYMKLFIYQNTWNLISIAKIHMQELKKKIRWKFVRWRVKLCYWVDVGIWILWGMTGLIGSTRLVIFCISARTNNQILTRLYRHGTYSHCCSFPKM